MMFDPLYTGILLVTLLISGAVSALVRSRFKAGQKVQIQSGLTGAEVAQAILADAGIYDVRIRTTQGFLSDYYNPMDRTLNLSDAVYHGRSASSAGVAAHEVGHAIQHAQNYFPMWVRSMIVPAANLGSILGPWIVIIGILLMSVGRITLGQNVAIAGIVLFGMMTLFTLVTVPVEFDASSRAKKCLARLNILAPGRERDVVAGVLFAAGLTYVAAAISSIMQLLYWALRAGLLGRRNN